MIKKAVSAAVTSLHVICSLILLALAVVSVLIQPRITLDYDETVSFVHNGPLFILQLLLFLAVLYVIRKPFQVLRPRILFVILESVWMISGIYLIEGLDHQKIRADQDSIYQNALLFNQGDYSALIPGNYLNRYQFQLGLLTMQRFPLYAGLRVHGLLYINLIMVLLIQFLLWRITIKLLRPSRIAENYILLLSFLFLPLLFYTMFIYGQIPGLLFSLSCVFFLLRYLGNGKSLDAILMTVFITLACAAKQNYKVAAIAICIVLFMIAVLKRNWKYILPVVIIPIVIFASDHTIIDYYEKVSGYEIIGGTPMVLNIAMGLQESTPTSLGGWYNEYNWHIYEETGFDSKKSKEIAIEDIKRSVHVYAANPLRFFRFYTYKIASSWNDPLYGGIWIGPRPAQGQALPKTKLLQDLYLGGNAYERTEDLMACMIIVVYFFSSLYPWLCRNNRSLFATTIQSLAYIYFLGGFLFHSFSEICGKYVFIYVFMLIPYAGIALSRCVSTKCNDEQDI